MVKTAARHVQCKERKLIMMKSIAAAIATAALVAAALFLQPIRGHKAAAQSAPLHIHAVDVVPGQADSYLAALKENGAASVKEPGCREFDNTVSQKDPNHVFIFEVYDNAAAAQTHRETEHFKKYAATTKDMVAKRELRPLSSVAMNIKGM